MAFFYSLVPSVRYKAFLRMTRVATTAAPVHLSLRRGLRTNRNSPYYMPPSLFSIGNYP
ncbi:hypothetical protein D3C87_951260 [compost metagenome]